MRRQKAADLALLNMGITFNVYGHAAGTEKVWPFDIIPRIIEFEEWKSIERGLKQRIHALNLFIDDLYHDQKILRDGVLPDWLIQSGKCFLKPCAGLNPPRRHLVPHHRHRPGARRRRPDVRAGRQSPLSLRRVLRAGKPRGDEADLLRRCSTACRSCRSKTIPNNCWRCCSTSRRTVVNEPTVVVLTPGVYNSAYFEHCFLAQQMGVELVQGSDLVVEDGYVYMRTTRGLQRVDVIYRRIDDDFLDPATFRPDSALGVPGLMDVYRAGHVALANAPGTGIADDKAVYAYVPQIIKYYLDEDILLPNVPTFICGDDNSASTCWPISTSWSSSRPTSRGVTASCSARGPRRETGEMPRADPGTTRGITSPSRCSALSRVPTIVGDHLEGRHVDLRPYILYGEDIYVLAGRIDPRGPGQGIDGRQFVARGRQQGYLGAEERQCRGRHDSPASDSPRPVAIRAQPPATMFAMHLESRLACSAESPIRSFGWLATSSGPKTWPASSTSI